MPIEGLEYQTNEWDGLKKSSVSTAPQTMPTKATDGPATATQATILRAQAAKVTQVKPDPIVAAITGFLDKLKAVFGWK